jgi:hypothetical protein
VVKIKEKNVVYHLLFNEDAMKDDEGYTYKSSHSFDDYFLKHKDHFIGE